MSFRQVSLFLVSLYFMLLASPSRAQMMTVGDDTSTPIQGAGHNYIQSVSDTVNPANGSVSVRIALPMPKGRQLALPFSITYDSNGIVSVSAEDARPHWYTPLPSFEFLSSGGWGYSLPMLTSRQWTKTTYDAQSGTTITCPLRSGYIFRDPTGGRHSLYLGNVGYRSNSNNRVLCGTPSIASGDPQFSGRFTVTPQPIGVLLTPTMVADNDGTRYYFAGNGPQELPNYIEDRNGNKITLFPSGGYTGTITVTDTLGRSVLSSSGFGSGTTTLSTPDQQFSVAWTPNSATYTIPVTVVKNNAPSGYGCAPVNTSVNPNGNVISSISLPNGKQYRFYYGTNPNPTYNNPYGMLSEIDYPTGASVKYTWKLSDNPNEVIVYGAVCNPLIQCNGPIPNACQVEYRSPVVATRTVSFGGTTIDEVESFIYNTAWNTSGTVTKWDSKSTNVTTTDKIRNLSVLTKYTYGSVLASSTPYVGYVVAQQIPVETQIQSYDWGNTTSPLRTVNKTWANQYLLTSSQTVLNDANNLSSKTVYSYDANSQLQEADEFDYGASAATRRTVTNYQSFAFDALLRGRIVDNPCQTIVYDGSNTRVSETDYYYDNGPTSTACGTSGTPVVAGVSGLVNTHDETDYGPSSTTVRDNLTQKTKWLNNGSSPITTYTYDETGQLLSVTDPCGSATCSDMTGSNHTTTFSYADRYTVLSGGQNVDYTPGSSTNAFLTGITDALGHTSTFKYDFFNGQLTQSTDPNAQSASYTYNDPLARPSRVDYPDGGQKTISYNDTPPNLSSTENTQIDVNTAILATTLTDGLGHVIESQLPSDPDGATYSDRTYDGLGRRFVTYNPTRCNPPQTNCGGESTWGRTSYAYDGLGRVTTVTQPDNSAVTTSYSGQCRTLTDEAGKSRKSCTDGLGRLTQVYEVTCPQLSFT